MVSFDEKNRFLAERQRMVKVDLLGRDITDPRVLSVMADLPREAFMKPEYADQAYIDQPVPIGLGQTISQPYIVALMTQSLELGGTEEVLEVGTGSGYQTAILARLCKKVYTIERYPDLSAQAQTALHNLGIENVEYCVGDGSCGWPDENAQFDRIILTAAIPQVPASLERQLREGGLLVAPVGDIWSQTLTSYKKEKAAMQKNFICGCRFVKLIGKYGFNE